MRSRNLRKLQFVAGLVLLVAMLLAGGTFALASLSQAADVPVREMGTLAVDVSAGPIFAGAQLVGNLAPGDGEKGALTVKNTGVHEVRVYLRHELEGAMFQRFAGDDHPLQVSYAIQVHNRFGLPVGAKIEVPVFSADQTSPSFLLQRNQYAEIIYTYAMPIDAGNSYQGATGQMDVTVFTRAIEDPPPTCEQLGNCPPPTCEELGNCPPPTCEELGNCPPPTCEELGNCPPPTCEQLGNCPPPTCEELGNCPPPTCEELGNCPPPTCEELGNCPPAPTDPEPEPPQGPPSPGQIPGGTDPETGVAVIGTALQGAAMLLAGGLLIVLARRKRKQ
ncbi:hypothetical protein EV586_108112 [Tumebacillus sp. BK434]|uniref:hypothetical protein n=1 Tax=Tumebacillus sp. BK434 TaxID=2512169 RepID=UPI001049E1BA|nr:hypothetical protein [Tumebacillus sp. BK434]TCP52737.1 hypothetical protein EV586_108112 [Tumebacillus sp. BK434]